jgi:protein-disulfide isomerase
MCLGRGFAEKHQKRALAIEKVEAQLNLHRIDDNKAMALGVTGSPSVFVNGKELQPQGLVGFS